VTLSPAGSTPRSAIRSHRALVVTVAGSFAIVACIAGCSTWQVGHSSLQRPNIETVHVTMFRNDDFRRDLGELMTEILCKEIEQNSGYTIASETEADSFLTGRVRYLHKGVTIEDRFDLPRGSDLAVSVECRWTDRFGQELQQSFLVPMPASLLVVEGHAELLPEAGQSVTTQTIDAMEQVAKQIRSQMDAPW
jgi:hypothetical protein